MRGQTKKIQIGRNKKSDHNIDQQHRKGTLRTNKWIKSMHINYYLRWQYAKQTSTLLDIAFVCGVVCARAWERQNWRPAARSFMDFQWTNCVGKEKEISRPACCSLTLLHIIYLLLHLIVLHVSAKSWNIATAKLDIFGFYLRILLSFRLFLIRLFGLLADFITEIVCIHFICCCFIMIHK